VTEGTARVGAAVELNVDHARRRLIRANHSATHLLHEALREVLGSHVAQKGSLVAPDRLRFDFSHPKPISDDEISWAEDIANEVVLQNGPVVTRLMSVDDAIAEGAMALFGEKYGDEVRVVSMGTATAGDKAGKTYSAELCGGTHVTATGDIGLVRIVSEGAVASGVRRVEALTGNAARRHLDEQDKRLRQAAATLKIAPSDLPSRLEMLVDERRRLDRELVEARKKLALGGGGEQTGSASEIVAGTGFIGRTVTGVSPKDLKALADDGKNSLGSGVVVFVGASDDGKASVVVGVTADLTARYSAVDLVRAASAALGGQGGGGRPDMAQAGGPDAGRADAAIAAVKAAMEAA
jgi:alanyl-tRNA synthetase